MKKEVVRFERVTQITNGSVMLENFNMHIFEKEIMGLLCLNACGQEELIELLCRNVPIHYGYVYFQEMLMNNYERSSMSSNKVSVIGHENIVMRDLTIIENIFLLKKDIGFSSNKKFQKELDKYTKGINIKINGEKLVLELNKFEMFVVELIKAVVNGAKLIIIRDISNLISSSELSKWHVFMKYYKSMGISFLYICNHHREVFSICDKVALMENGRILKVLNPVDFTDKMIDNFTIDFSRKYFSPPKSLDDEGVLQFKNINTNNIRNINFTVAKAECVVILDKHNTILQDIMSLLNYRIKAYSGDILLEGKSIYKDSKNVKKKISFITQNPLNNMLFKNLSYLDNFCFLTDNKISPYPFTKKMKKSIIKDFEKYIGEDIYSTDLEDISQLSLYNLIYYRVLLFNPKVVVCFQPFAGADMYSRHRVINLINQLRVNNIAVLILAVTISDVLVVADRLYVAEKGKLTNEYKSNEFQKI